MSSGNRSNRSACCRQWSLSLAGHQRFRGGTKPPKLIVNAQKPVVYAGFMLFQEPFVCLLLTAQIAEGEGLHDQRWPGCLHRRCIRCDSIFARRLTIAKRAARGYAASEQRASTRPAALSQAKLRPSGLFKPRPLSAVSVQDAACSSEAMARFPGLSKGRAAERGRAGASRRDASAESGSNLENATEFWRSAKTAFVSERQVGRGYRGNWRFEDMKKGRTLLEYRPVRGDFLIVVVQAACASDHSTTTLPRTKSAARWAADAARTIIRWSF